MLSTDELCSFCDLPWLIYESIKFPPKSSNHKTGLHTSFVFAKVIGQNPAWFIWKFRFVIGKQNLWYCKQSFDFNHELYWVDSIMSNNSDSAISALADTD